MAKHPKLEAAWNQYKQLLAKGRLDRRPYIIAVIDTYGYGKDLEIDWMTGEIETKEKE
jgi:hypothetical protein